MIYAAANEKSEHLKAFIWNTYRWRETDETYHKSCDNQKNVPTKYHNAQPNRE